MAKKPKRASTEFKQYASEQRPGEALTDWYKRLAQTANKRLERAEKYQQQEYFKPASKWAYAVAQHDIKAFRGEHATRFAGKASGTESQIRSQINSLRKYLASPTSTKQGIISVYNKRAETFNKKYGTNFTWEQLAKYFESGEAKKWEEKFGSKTALKTIGELQKNKKDVLKSIEENTTRDIRVEDSILQKTVSAALADNDLDIVSLFA